MKKMKGIVDPVTLSLVLALGIAGVGIATDHSPNEPMQQAQNSESQVEPAIKPSKSEAGT